MTNVDISNRGNCGWVGYVATVYYLCNLKKNSNSRNLLKKEKEKKTSSVSLTETSSKSAFLQYACLVQYEFPSSTYLGTGEKRDSRQLGFRDMMCADTHTKTNLHTDKREEWKLCP